MSIRLDDAIVRKLEVKNEGQFKYTGIQEAATAVARPIWFATSGGPETPVYNDNFQYNPNTLSLELTPANGGNAYLKTTQGVLRLQSASTLYINRGDACSLIFQLNGTENARFDTSGHFRPREENVYSLGTTSYPWKDVYARRYLAYATGATYAYLNASTLGTTNTVGIGRLSLGNNIAEGAANNAKGQILFYGKSTSYLIVETNIGANSRTLYLRDHGKTAYTVGTAGTSAVGGSTHPVYVNSSGLVTACGSLWTNSDLDSTTEFQVGATSAAGKIYLYSQETSTKNRGIYGSNSSGTQVSILVVDKDNNVSLNGSSIKLASGKTLKVSLGSTNASTAFDGTANVHDIGVSGVLAVGNGGTGTATAPVAGGVIYGASTSAYGCTAVGSSGQLLQSGGTGKPSWITATSSNTGNTIVKRNSSGNFSAGTITATLSGNASTASKWATARTITVSKDYTGSVSIDGSADKTLNITAYKSAASGNNTNTYPWRRIAYISGASSSYSDYDCILDIRATYDNTRFGRIKISYRTNDASTSKAISCHARWIYRSGFNLNDLVIASWGVSGQACYADVFLNCGGSWPRLEINQVYGERKWTLVTSSEATNAASRTEAYSTVAAAGTELHSKAYTGTWDSEDAPTVVNYSHSTGSVAWTSITGKPSSYTPASHTHNYLPLTGGTISGNVSFSAAASGTSPLAQRISINGVAGDNSVANAPGIGFHTGNVGWGSIKCVGSSFYFYNSDCSDYVPIYGSKVYGAVWNDYAEYRTGETIEAGKVSYCDNDGKLKITSNRLQKFEGVVSDTYGFAIGQTDNAKTPLAVSGRVLVYTHEPRDAFNSGDCVCAAPNGTVSKMTREEIVTYPDRIVGIVSEIPDYETWGTGKVPVNGRIWIKVK